MSRRRAEVAVGLALAWALTACAYGSPDPTTPSSPLAATAGSIPASIGTTAAPETTAPTVSTRPTVPTLAPSSTTPIPTPTTAASSPAASAAPSASGFNASSRSLTAAEQKAMTGVSWHPGCPVPLSGLRRLTVTYVGFDNRDHEGVLIVNADAVERLTTVFRELYRQGFPIRRMEPVDVFGGDDWASIEADNTSAFNCRRRTGSTTEWSRHAYGMAVDLNPLENPYVTNGTTSHPRSRTYLDRADVRPGMLLPGSPAVQAFAAVGWPWGGLWRNPTDLQHFSDTGR